MKKIFITLFCLTAITAFSQPITLNYSPSADEQLGLLMQYQAETNAIAAANASLGESETPAPIPAFNKQWQDSYAQRVLQNNLRDLARDAVGREAAEVLAKYRAADRTKRDKIKAEADK